MGEEARSDPARDTVAVIDVAFARIGIGIVFFRTRRAVGIVQRWVGRHSVRRGGYFHL